MNVGLRYANPTLYIKRVEPDVVQLLQFAPGRRGKEKKVNLDATQEL